jgi:putative FmdB family regulatory protein
MPIYEYHCSKCGDFEVMQKMSDAPLSECPTCHRKVRKLMSSTSFQLKGSGWYVTDYGKKGNAGGKADEKKSDDKKASDKKAPTESAGESKETKSESTGSSSSSDSGGTGKSGEKAAAA